MSAPHPSFSKYFFNFRLEFFVCHNLLLIHRVASSRDTILKKRGVFLVPPRNCWKAAPGLARTVTSNARQCSELPVFSLGSPANIHNRGRRSDSPSRQCSEILFVFRLASRFLD